MNLKNLSHPFHLVTLSPWPILTSLSLMNLTLSTISMFNFYFMDMMIMSMMLTIICSFQWWRDIIRESTYQGFHTNKVITHMKMGMMLFIVSEIFFFISFFWAFFHMMLSPSIEIGSIWPPKGVYTFNPFNIPLLNSMILLSSGSFITWSHHSIMKNNFFQASLSMTITIFLGLIFTMFQFIEYNNSLYSINDSIYGSTFFMTTGFHGIHVIIGTIFIWISLNRLLAMHFSNIHLFGIEASLWYWHFVDVVWLFLYTFMYWWPY